MKLMLRRLRFRRFSAVQLLIALALFFTCVPFLEEMKGGDLIISSLVSLVLLAGILAVAHRRRTLVVAILLAIPTLAARWANHFRPDLVPPRVFLIGGLLVFTFVVAHLLRFVLRAPSVTPEVLCASISAYLMLGFICTLAYWLADRLTPRGALSFNADERPRCIDRLTRIHASVTTLCTVGYG